ncbi:ATP-binding protein [Kineococcus sp. SYSU DK001]|uniref:ATP-binding protein n=1 Tax=Kineococcus sp. SYSU DK001 TaxID=3383122 RepID=UPI003D7D90E9
MLPADAEPPVEVTLPAEAGSAARARDHTRRVLRQVLGRSGTLDGHDAAPRAGAPGRAGTPDPAALEAVVADAEVCVSEMVTNAVLHAGTPLTVVVTADVTTEATTDAPADGVHRDGLPDPRVRVRLEVRDGSTVEPQWVPRSLTASTGRGLKLITALSAARGVQRHDGGKTVWCELSTAGAVTGGERAGTGVAAPDREADLDAVLAEEWSSVVADLLADPVPAPSAPTAPAPAPSPRGGVEPALAAGATLDADQRPIRLVDYPLHLGVRMREHREAVLRELRLLTLTHAVTDPATADLVGRIADLLSAEYAGHLSSASAQVLRALVAGADHVELRYPRLEDHERLVEQWRTGLRDLERLTAETGLVTSTTPRDVDELGNWVVEEFSRQLRGAPPRPWTGPG